MGFRGRGLLSGKQGELHRGMRPFGKRPLLDRIGTADCAAVLAEQLQYGRGGAVVRAGVGDRNDCVLGGEYF